MVSVSAMDAVYLKIREIARAIAARYPQPDFYRDHAAEAQDSRRFYEADRSIGRLRREVAAGLDDNVGHGMGHMEKVAIDAGALVIIESRSAGQKEARIRRNLLMAQCAGLLHDIRRKENAHALKGADAARHILARYPLIPAEVDHICAAIRNHEAFVQRECLPERQTRMISDCLYDADKFRWGPDNFTHTVWDMVADIDPPLARFMARYPKGMARLKEIRDTFRSRTGRRYGPQFIDMGLAIGEELYASILEHFGDAT